MPLHETVAECLEYVKVTAAELPSTGCASRRRWTTTVT